MTQKEFDWLKKLEANVDKYWDDLTDWEKKFMENRLEAFRQYRENTQISKAQWNIITRISEKII